MKRKEISTFKRLLFVFSFIMCPIILVGFCAVWFYGKQNEQEAKNLLLVLFPFEANRGKTRRVMGHIINENTNNNPLNVDISFLFIYSLSSDSVILHSFSASSRKPTEYKIYINLTEGTLTEE